ncbi:uncharacterized protein [Drosophila pseudoobscura]|uniref:Uncharacterized protein n=1 Tax=Drosophila pseudoobscura pseudoobscura TaxID=46245 RepID=Q2M0N8_DROPS|nr:uncharacterized protein LOC4813659 [Drosophila pseudoobscura]
MHSTGQKSLLRNMASSPYGKEVLIGNWAERRYEIDEKSNAAVPGVRAPEGCEKYQTVSQRTYTNAPFTGIDTVQNYSDQRQEAFQNLRKNSTSSLSLVDHISLTRNFTTTTTLTYEVLPQRFLKKKQLDSGNCGPPQRQPELDMLQSFGNLTRTYNYKKLFKCEKLLAHLAGKAQTTYRSSYNRALKSEPIMEFGPDYDGVVKFDLTC